MDGIQIVATDAGPVEVRYLPCAKPPILLFPGGHSSAATPTGEHLYTALGYGVLCFSRPGYGGTDVGPLTAAEYVSLVVETCRRLGIERSTGAVGVSFGGLQAIHTAALAPELAPKLILHSCAPSVLPYPDTSLERAAARYVFGAATQKMTWATIRRLVASDAGLRLMMKSLTRLPDDQWWSQMSSTDRASARAIFNAMGSNHGLVNDIRQANRQLSGYRAHIHSLVGAPTLVTASRSDGAVSLRHAQNFAATIRCATFYETTSPTHLHWIGHEHTGITAAIANFLSAP